jgi:uncharacterized protein YndB with AHSA1/START domain
MTLDPDRILRITRRFAAPPERVFDAWLEPALVRRWLFRTPIDEQYTAEIDPRVGGAYTITARRGGMDYTAVGEYLEIERPRRLVLTFAMPQFAPDVDRLIVELEPDGTGCVMTFTQVGLPPDYKEASESGWGSMFAALEALLGEA